MENLDIYKSEANRYVSKIKNEIVMGRYALKSLSQDILQMVIAQIENEFTVLPEFQFQMRDIEKNLGRRIKDDEMEKVVLDIVDHKIRVKTEEVFEGYNWVDYAKYSKIDKVFKIRFTSTIGSLLLDIVKQKGFTLLNSKIFYKLKSSYSKRIYMLMKGRVDYAKSKNLEAFKFQTSVEDLRLALGIEENEYKNFYDFKKRVLVTAEKQINKESDIEIKIKYKKEGRNVKEIVFTAEPNSNFKKEEVKQKKKGSTVKKVTKNTGVDSVEAWLQEFKAEEEIIEVEVN